MEINNEKNNENEYFKRVQENEYLPININNIDNYINKSNTNLNVGKNNYKLYFLNFIILLSLLSIMIYIIKNIVKATKKENSYLNEDIIKIFNKENNNLDNNLKLKYNRINNKKKGIAFIYSSKFGKEIERMLSLLLNELIKIEDKYELFLITDKENDYDLYIEEEVKRLPIFGNKNSIERLDKTRNIEYYVLNNECNFDDIMFYKSLNKKIINIMYGSYFSWIITNRYEIYKNWKNNFLFDAFISLVPDDYYIYTKLGMNNTFYLPSIYEFDSSKTLKSNLTYNNIMIIGGENDLIKDDIYGIKAASLIIREIPDAKLYFISYGSRIDYINDLAIYFFFIYKIIIHIKIKAKTIN